MSDLLLRVERAGRIVREQPAPCMSAALGFAEILRRTADSSTLLTVLLDGVVIHTVHGCCEGQHGHEPVTLTGEQIALRIGRPGSGVVWPKVTLDCALSHAEILRKRTDRSVWIAVVVDGVEVRVVRGRHPSPKHHLGRQRPPWTRPDG